MSWYAKPNGAYALNSNEAKNNAIEIANVLRFFGFTKEAQAGIIGNAYDESGLNPWRWQSDTVDNSNGYGLYQYTPATTYLNGATAIQNYSPNLSTSSQTSGATPKDGIAQTIVLAQDTIGKWYPYCWRGYWSPTDYPDLYALHTSILNKYGDGDFLSINAFSRITNLREATFAFLACFEGPAYPDMETRLTYANYFLNVIGGGTPVTPSKSKKMPLWFYLRPYF